MVQTRWMKVKIDMLRVLCSKDKSVHSNVSRFPPWHPFLELQLLKHMAANIETYHSIMLTLNDQ